MEGSAVGPVGTPSTVSGHRLRRRTQTVVNYVEDAYLRDDVSCGSALCASCVPPPGEACEEVRRAMARFTLVFVWGTDLDEVLPEATAEALADVADGWQRSGKVVVYVLANFNIWLIFGKL